MDIWGQNPSSAPNDSNSAVHAEALLQSLLCHWVNGDMRSVLCEWTNSFPRLGSFWTVVDEWPVVGSLRAA